MRIIKLREAELTDPKSPKEQEIGQEKKNSPQDKCKTKVRSTERMYDPVRRLCRYLINQSAKEKEKKGEGKVRGVGVPTLYIHCIHGRTLPHS